MFEIGVSLAACQLDERADAEANQAPSLDFSQAENSQYLPVIF